MMQKIINRFLTPNVVGWLVSVLVVCTGVLNFTRTIYPLLNSSQEFNQALAGVEFNIFVFVESSLAYILLISGLALPGRSRAVWIICITTICLLLLTNLINFHQSHHFFFKLLSFGVMLITYPYFKRQFYLTYGFVFIAAFIIFALFYGSMGSYILRHEFAHLNSFSDAIYFSIITYSTVGYGDIYPLTEAAKFFVISMVLIGLIMFTSGITLLAFTLNSKIKNVLLHLNKGKVAMTNHIIFCGFGVLTKILVERYRKSGQEFIVLDRAHTLDLDHQRLQDENRLIITPYPGDTRAMIKARVSEAKMIIIGYDSDADTVFSVMSIAKFLTGVINRPKIVARITFEENIQMAVSAGADQVIAPQVLAADAIKF